MLALLETSKRHTHTHNAVFWWKKQKVLKKWLKSTEWGRHRKLFRKWPLFAIKPQNIKFKMPMILWGSRSTHTCTQFIGLLQFQRQETWHGEIQYVFGGGRRILSPYRNFRKILKLDLFVFLRSFERFYISFLYEMFPNFICSVCT